MRCSVALLHRNRSGLEWRGERGDEGGAHIWAWAGSLSPPAGRPARAERGFEVRRLNAAEWTLRADVSSVTWKGFLLLSDADRTACVPLLMVCNWAGLINPACMLECEILRYEPRSGNSCGHLHGPQGPKCKGLHQLEVKVKSIISLHICSNPFTITAMPY